jgi:hypothetical protein
MASAMGRPSTEEAMKIPGFLWWCIWNEGEGKGNF